MRTTFMYWNLKRVLGTLFVLSFIGSIVYYAYYQSRGIIAGPSITLTSPVEGALVTDSLVRISGNVQRAKELSLDGRGIFIDLSGNFNEELLLTSGYNIIELAAKDAEGREVKKAIPLVWNGTDTPAKTLLPNAEKGTTSTEAITQ
jgi:hypothetical protein